MILNLGCCPLLFIGLIPPFSWILGTLLKEPGPKLLGFQKKSPPQPLEAAESQAFCFIGNRDCKIRIHFIQRCRQYIKVKVHNVRRCTAARLDQLLVSTGTLQVRDRRQRRLSRFLQQPVVKKTKEGHQRAVDIIPPKRGRTQQISDGDDQRPVLLQNSCHLPYRQCIFLDPVDHPQTSYGIEKPVFKRQCSGVSDDEVSSVTATEVLVALLNHSRGAVQAPELAAAAQHG